MAKDFILLIFWEPENFFLWKHLLASLDLHVLILNLNTNLLITIFELIYKNNKWLTKTREDSLANYVDLVKLCEWPCGISWNNP